MVIKPLLPLFTSLPLFISFPLLPPNTQKDLDTGLCF